MISSKSTASGVIGGGSVTKEYGNFGFNLGPVEDEKYHKITVVGMKNVTAGFGQYDLKEIGQEFRATANPAEIKYILSETVGGTKVIYS